MPSDLNRLVMRARTRDSSVPYKSAMTCGAKGLFCTGAIWTSSEATIWWSVKLHMCTLVNPITPSVISDDAW